MPDYSIGSANSYNNTGGYNVSTPTQNNGISGINYVASDNPDFSYLVNSALNIGLTSQPEQTHLKGLDKSLMQNRKYDSFFNGDKSAVRSWQNTLNDLYDTGIKVDGISGSEFINNYNSINIPDRLQFYNTYLKYRLPTVRDKNRKGISNRTKRYR